MTLDLPLVWACIIAFAILAYVVLDSFDLGVGILFPLAKSDDEHSQMLEAITPQWDGNETWLVMGGGGLFAVFPNAYATLLPALYIPIITMLLSLIFRGVAFEFRWQEGAQKFWDKMFFIGSTTAAFMQGVVVGAMIQGIKIENHIFVGGTWDWLTPFSISTGIALVCGYALLGSTWLIKKTEGSLNEKMHRLAKPAAILTIGLIILNFVYTAILHPHHFQNWTSLPIASIGMVLFILFITFSYKIFTTLNTAKELQPFLCSIGLFITCYLSLLISFYPNIIPPSLTIRSAAAPDVSLQFALYGAIVLLPIILSYTAYSYWVFRGKIKPEDLSSYK